MCVRPVSRLAVGVEVLVKEQASVLFAYVGERVLFNLRVFKMPAARGAFDIDFRLRSEFSDGKQSITARNPQD